MLCSDRTANPTFFHVYYCRVATYYLSAPVTWSDGTTSSTYTTSTGLYDNAAGYTYC